MMPPCCHLGIGHESAATLEDALGLVARCLAEAGLQSGDIAGIASIEAKSAAALVEGVGRHFALPVRYFGAARLEAETPRLANPSDIVFRALGCHGVAEAAALAAAGRDARLILPKTAGRGVTCAIAGYATHTDKSP